MPTTRRMNFSTGGIFCQSGPGPISPAVGIPYLPGSLGTTETRGGLCFILQSLVHVPEFLFRRRGHSSANGLRVGLTGGGDFFNLTVPGRLAQRESIGLYTPGSRVCSPAAPPPPQS